MASNITLKANTKRVERVLFRSALSILLMSIALQACTINRTVIINIKVTTMKKSQKQAQNFKHTTKYEAYNNKPRGEKFILPSKTSQGEAVSMADMIRRYTRGEIPPLAANAFHGYDVDMDLHYGSRPASDLTEIEQEVNAAKAAEKERKLQSKLQTPTDIDRTSVGETGATQGSSEADDSQSEG